MEINSFQLLLLQNNTALKAKNRKPLANETGMRLNEKCLKRFGTQLLRFWIQMKVI